MTSSKCRSGVSSIPSSRCSRVPAPGSKDRSRNARRAGSHDDEIIVMHTCGADAAGARRAWRGRCRRREHPALQESASRREFAVGDAGHSSTSSIGSAAARGAWSSATAVNATAPGAHRPRRRRDRSHSSRRSSTAGMKELQSRHHADENVRHRCELIRAPYNRDSERHRARQRRCPAR